MSSVRLDWRRESVDDVKKKKTVTAVARALTAWRWIASDGLAKLSDENQQIESKRIQKRYNKELKALREELADLIRPRVVAFLERWLEGEPPI